MQFSFALRSIAAKITTIKLQLMGSRQHTIIISSRIYLMTAQAVTRVQPRSKKLHIALWVVQVLLAFAFVGAGLTKLTTPMPDLVAQMAWAESWPAAMVRFIGLAQLLGAIGLILPAALRILPRLTGLAAAGLATTMILATLLHVVRGEFEVLPLTIGFSGLALFVAWGRGLKAPIAPRA
jgi:uncharacterized membrane protein YphA (DoxX/SURF4 family)